MQNVSRKAFFKTPSAAAGLSGGLNGPVPYEVSGKLPQEWLGQLGFFDKLRVKATTRREIAEYVGAAFTTYFKAHAEVNARRSALWVEEQSVIDLNASQLRMQEVEREMTLVATEYADELSEALFQYCLRFRERKAIHKREVEARRKAGALADADADAMLSLSDNIVDSQCEDVIERVNAVLGKMKERIARALELFQAGRVA